MALAVLKSEGLCEVLGRTIDSSDFQTPATCYILHFVFRIVFPHTKGHPEVVLDICSKLGDLQEFGLKTRFLYVQGALCSSLNNFREQRA